MAADRGFAAYTEAINLMNYSAVVIPVTKADKNIDLVDRTYQPADGDDKKNWNGCKSAPVQCFPVFVDQHT